MHVEHIECSEAKHAIVKLFLLLYLFIPAVYYTQRAHVFQVTDRRRVVLSDRSPRSTDIPYKFIKGGLYDHVKDGFYDICTLLILCK